MKELKKTQLKWIGWAAVIMSLGSIFTYEIYSRTEFMVTQILLLIYGFILLYIYFLYNFKDTEK